MYTKRNVTMNRNTIKTSSTINSTFSKSNKSNSFKLKVDGLSKYSFPLCDEVPGGVYFSEIKKARPTFSSSGRETIEVFYVMRDRRVCHALVNNLPMPYVDDKTYYIKQSYPLGTTYYSKFAAAMAENLNIKKGDELELDDIVGVTELIELSYKTSTSIGGIKERIPYDHEDFYGYTKRG